MDSETSYLPDFFTADRLEWYRSLSERFPLWCGLWSQDVLDLPEAVEWNLDRLIWAELDEAEEEHIGYWFEPRPTSDVMPTPVLVVRELSEDTGRWPDEPEYIEHRYSLTGPRVYGAWFAAINYMAHDWSNDPLEPRKQPRVLGNADHLLKALQAVLTRHPMEKPNQHGLIRRIRELRTQAPGTVRREEAIVALEQYWLDIGRAAGILLPIKGGTKLYLPDAMLAQLQIEADEFAHEIKDWDPSEAARGIAPLPAEADQDEDDSDSPAAWLRQERAKRGLAAPELPTTPDAELVMWSRVLRYPFLNADEIQMILDSRRGRRSAATALMLCRLPGVHRTTLLKHIRRA